MEGTMKSKLKRGFSLLLVTMMLTCVGSAGVMAEEVSVQNEAQVNQESIGSVQPPQQINLTEEEQDLNNKSTMKIEEKPYEQVESGVSQDAMLSAEIQTSDSDPNYICTATTGGVYISQYLGSGGDLIIPSTIDGIKVIGIGSNSFINGGVNYSEITSVTIPEGVTYIGNSAFSGCQNLSSINIPVTMKSIGDGAFNNCTNLKEINIPKNLTSIGSYVFEGCLSLTSIEVAVDNLKYASLEGVLYNKTGNTLLTCPGGLASIAIPVGVISIAPYAFNNCTNLTNVSLPEGFVNIGDYAFSGCTYLMHINIPESVSKIGTYAFMNCSSLMSISIPKSATNIGDYVFYNCTNLMDVSLAEGIEKIPIGTFSNCNSLTNILLPQSLTSIGDSAFSDCSSLSSIIIPEKVISIGSGSFQTCSSLSSISLTDGLTRIGAGAFRNCIGLTNITIPNTVVIIGDNVFDSCLRLKNLIIPEGVLNIGYYAFQNCTDLKSISIPKSVQFIDGISSFTGCESLTSITIAAGNSNYTSSGGLLLSKDGTTLIRCPEGVTTANIPTGVTSIGDYAFRNCKNLTSVNIPETVTSIGGYAFENCVLLVKVVIPESVIKIDYANYYGTTFGGCNLLVIYGISGSYAENYANRTYIPFNGSGYFRINSFTTDKVSGQYINTDIILTAAGSGGTSPYQYRFYYKLGSVETVIQNFSTLEMTTFKPTDAGNYTLFVDVRDGDGNVVSKNISDYTIFSNPYVSSLTTDKPSGQGTNTDINLTAIGAGGAPPYQYKFYYRIGNSNTFIQDFSEVNTAIFKPQAVGTYTLYVEMKDANEKAVTSSIGNYIIVKPVAPVNLKTSEISNNSVAIAWDAITGASSYNVYKNGVRVNADPITGTNFKVEGLTAKTEYTFTVKSLVNTIESDASTALKVKTMGDPVNLNVGTVTGAPGKNVIVKVDVSNNSSISAARFIVGFDNSKLEYIATNPGTLAQGGTIVTNLAGNQVTIGYINQKMITEAGTFLELEFKIKDGMADQNLPITLTSLELTDLTGFELIPVISNGEIKISGIIIGDINGDGAISAFDALMALQIATGKIVPTTTQKTAADIDGNGMISAFESLRILQFATGKTTIL
jgi:hypothetical protein